MGFFFGKKDDRPRRTPPPVNGAGNDKVLAEFRNWLAHPNELGHEPKDVKVLKKYLKVVPGFNEFKPVPIHLCQWTDHDGSIGRGFVGPITWAFMGDNLAGISNDDLVTAYCGWAMVFGLMHAEGYEPVEKCQCEDEVLEFLRGTGVSDMRIDERIVIGDSEILSISGVHDGKKIRLAISDDHGRLFFTEDMPQYHLPPSYFYLGGVAQG